MNREPRRSAPVARGDEIDVDVDGLGDGPDGVAHLGAYVLFVPGVLPGERARVRVTSAARKFGRADLVEITATDPGRVTPACAHFLACGGCHRQHQDYRAQLADKQDRLQRAAAFALGDEAPPVAPTIGMRPALGHRHKVALHLRNRRDGGLEACFHRLRSPELVPVHECPASDPLAWDLAQAAVELLGGLGRGAWDPDFAPHDLLRTVLVRTTTIGEAHLVVVAREHEVPGLVRLVPALHRAGITTIAVNRNRGEFSQLLGPDTHIVSGPPRIRERILDVDYLLSPTAFFQTSPAGAEHLVRLVLDWLAPTSADVVADLFCGGGLLGLPLARRARTLFGVELNRAAVGDAIASARQNGIGNARFVVGPVASWLRSCRDGALPRPGLVAVDPPRTGLDADVIAELRTLRPAKVAYVSCDPRSLQRDLGELHRAGFTLRHLTGVDMFPQTCHVEAVACLEPTAG